MKKLIALVTFLMLITGCANNPQPSTPNVQPNPKLPLVKNFVGYGGRNQVGLHWDPVPDMKGYYIQRFSKKDGRWIPVATIDNPFKTLYVDTDLTPSTLYKYRIATFDEDGTPSLAVETKVKTKPTIARVVPLEAKPIYKGTIKITFRPHPNERVKQYLIQKFNDTTIQWNTIKVLYPRLNVEFLDTGLKDGKIYKYRIIAKSFDGLKSHPTKPIYVSTFPKPPIITQIEATKNLPKKIIVTWKKPKSKANKYLPIKYYKVYISPDANAIPFKFYKISYTTKLVDKINKDGFKRYYKVTQVSIYDTESSLKDTPSVMGETLPKPLTPIVSTNVSGNLIEFIFTSPDNRAVKYLIIKEERTGLFKIKRTKIITPKNIFRDRIDPNKTYVYYIYEVDKYGLISAEPAKVIIGK